MGGKYPPQKLPIDHASRREVQMNVQPQEVIILISSEDEKPVETSKIPARTPSSKGGKGKEVLRHSEPGKPS